MQRPGHAGNLAIAEADFAQGLFDKAIKEIFESDASYLMPITQASAATLIQHLATSGEFWRLATFSTQPGLASDWPFELIP